MHVLGFVIPIMLAAAACDSSTDATVARLELRADGQPVDIGGTLGFSAGGLQADSEGVVATLHLVDTGLADLVIEQLELTSVPPGALRLTLDGTTLAPLPSGPIAVEPQAVDEDALLPMFLVMKGSPAVGVRATLTVRSNHVGADGSAASEVKYLIEQRAGTPVMTLAPERLAFGRVAVGSTVESRLTILNAGSDPLVISEVGLSGQPGFAIGEVDGAETPWFIASAGARTLTVSYTASKAGAALGELRLRSNDPQTPDGTVVQLEVAP